MSDDHPSSTTTEKNERSDKHERSWLDKVLHAFSAEPKSRDELLEIIKDAADNQLLDQEALSIIEGALDVSSLQAREIMVPRSHIVAIRLEDSPQEYLPQIIESGHSRFPVIGENIDDVKGILLAKDLLKLQRAPELNIRALLRPAVFVPESKGLNDLLREFRGNRNHLAVVIDEFGRVAGLVTIEDVLEQIVGEIEDEFDEEDRQSSIFTLADGSQRVAGDALIDAVNEVFQTQLPDDEFETIGGLVAHELGRVPRRGESVDVGGLRFVVMLARGGAVRWFKVTRAPDMAPVAEAG